VKLADFGLARRYSYPVQAMTMKVVTLWYRAPELLLGSKSYTTAIDMWALGCVLAELLLNKPLLPGENDQDQIRRIFRLFGGPSSRIWPGVDETELVRSGVYILSVEREKYPFNTLRVHFPNLKDEGIELLNEMFTYDPSKRISVPPTPSPLLHFSIPLLSLSSLSCIYSQFFRFSSFLRLVMLLPIIIL
jgi:cyclin-dependent kinase 10